MYYVHVFDRRHRTMLPFVAVPLATVLSVISAIHLCWMVRGVGARASVPSYADGTPVFRPGRLACLGVAIALAVAVVIVLGWVRLLDIGIPRKLLEIGIWGIGAVFGARTIGDFRYAGVFKRVRGTPFAKWDTRLFTPLCLVIAVAAVLLASTSASR